MVELRFRIRNTVFDAGVRNRRTTIRPITFHFPTLEEAALLASVDDAGKLVPRNGVFSLSHPRTGPVIEGFVDCALGEFVRAQLEALSADGQPPAKCEVHGLEPFMETFEPEQTERLRDLISVCEFRTNEFTPESAVRFLKDTGFSISTSSSVSNTAGDGEDRGASRLLKAALPTLQRSWVIWPSTSGRNSLTTSSRTTSTCRRLKDIRRRGRSTSALFWRHRPHSLASFTERQSSGIQWRRTFAFWRSN